MRSVVRFLALTPTSSRHEVSFGLLVWLCLLCRLVIGVSSFISPASHAGFALSVMPISNRRNVFAGYAGLLVGLILLHILDYSTKALPLTATLAWLCLLCRLVIGVSAFISPASYAGSGFVH